MNARTHGIVQQLKNALEAMYGARLRRVVVFGSQARGDAELSSDVDLLVVLKGPVQPGAEIARTGEIVAELSLQAGAVISCLFMDEDRYLHRAGPLLRNIRREGVPA